MGFTRKSFPNINNQDWAKQNREKNQSMENFKANWCLANEKGKCGKAMEEERETTDLSMSYKFQRKEETIWNWEVWLLNRRWKRQSWLSILKQTNSDSDF